MCFSLQADLVAGAALLPVAVVSLREVRRSREIPFAALPLLFAVHQLVEAVVWAGAEGHVSRAVQHAAAMAYLIFAFPVLPDTSLWCVYAAFSSVFIAVHMVRRRRLPDSDRLQGQPTESTALSAAP